MASPKENSPAPIVFPPSQRWDGNDGRWSTFDIHVGTPPQPFRVLPAPATGEIYVPHPQGCMNATEDCGHLRGVNGLDTEALQDGFQPNVSTTWHEIGWYATGLREDLNHTGNGLYGKDTLGLMLPESGGTVLEQQLIAAVANKNVFIGVFGLDPKPANFSDFNAPQPVFIKNLKDQKMIPSLSYGYTAGAYYKTPQSFGSLTLGGYDASRFAPNNNITYPFDPDDERPLSVSVQSITTVNSFNNSRSLLPEPIYVQLDFTVPHLWLPPAVCDDFANTFRLEYDNTTSLYLINSTNHEELLKRNPSITIGLGNSPNPDERVNVKLPYAAFDLQASWPWYQDATNYFPIRRADNKTQYTLGRTFMQEAYIIADYERGNFSVHQALFPATTEKQQIVAIQSPSSEAPTTQGLSPQNSSKRLNGGQIAGIVVGAVAFVALCLGLVGILLQKRRRARKAQMDQSLESDIHHDEKKAAEALSDEVYELKSPVGQELEVNGQKCELESKCAYELAASSPHYELSASESREKCPGKGE